MEQKTRCTSCGRLISSNAAFCPECGAKIKNYEIQDHDMPKKTKFLPNIIRCKKCKKIMHISYNDYPTGCPFCNTRFYILPFNRIVFLTLGLAFLLSIHLIEFVFLFESFGPVGNRSGFGIWIFIILVVSSILIFDIFNSTKREKNTEYSFFDNENKLSELRVFEIDKKFSFTSGFSIVSVLLLSLIIEYDMVIENIIDSMLHLFIAVFVIILLIIHIFSFFFGIYNFNENLENKID